MMPDRARLFLVTSLLVTGSAGDARAQSAAPLDMEKAIAFGSGPAEIPLLAKDDGIGDGPCETVELASPALRVARVSRTASREGRVVDPQAAANAARASLSVLYSRQPFRKEGPRFVQSRGILDAPGPSAPTPCPELRRPDRLLIAGPSGDPLEPIRATEVHERRWTGKLGASGVTLGAIAEFDFEKALALGGARWLEVRVVYAEGKPGVFRFSSKELQRLTPSWAR